MSKKQTVQIKPPQQSIPQPPDMMGQAGSYRWHLFVRGMNPVEVEMGNLQGQCKTVIPHNLGIPFYHTSRLVKTSSTICSPMTKFCRVDFQL